MNLFKKIIFTSLLSLLFSSTLLAKIPNFPADCFSGKSFCSKSDVIRINVGRVIRVEIFADLSQSHYLTVEDIKARYFDFSKWPDYVSASDNLKFKDSQEQSVIMAGEEYVAHMAHYVAKAPWPIRSMEVKDLVYYKFIENPETVLSARFDQAPDFSGRRGIKYNAGELHLLKKKSGEGYLVYFVTDIIPGIDLLPNVAQPYIEKVMFDVIKGMFELR